MKGDVKQLIHIFRKDIRYLAREIGLIVALAVLLAWTETHSPGPWWAELLLAAAAAYAIARLIHAEAIAGDRQFWITRPYRWPSLLGAKLLFIALCINLPIFLARLYIVFAAGLPVTRSIGPLLWSQALMFAGAALPVAALAAMTSGIVPFLFSVLILLAAGFEIQEMLVPPGRPGARVLLISSQWVWDAVAVLAFIAVALAALLLQYRTRQTRLSRWIAVGGALAGAAAYLYIPWPVAAELQTHLSKEPVGNSMRLTLDMASQLFFLRERPGVIQIEVPMAVGPLPDRTDLLAEGFSLSVEAPDGAIWTPSRYGFPTVRRTGERADAVIYNANTTIPRPFYVAHRDQPVTVRVSLYLTLFGKGRSVVIPLRDRPVDAIDGVQCFAGLLQQLVCRSAFRWPGSLVSATFPNNEKAQMNQSISYSPFPAGMEFSFAESRVVAAPSGSREATLTVQEPLAHVRKAAEFRGTRLSDYAQR